MLEYLGLTVIEGNKTISQLNFCHNLWKHWLVPSLKMGSWKDKLFHHAWGQVTHSHMYIQLSYSFHHLLKMPHHNGKPFFRRYLEYTFSDLKWLPFVPIIFHTRYLSTWIPNFYFHAFLPTIFFNSSRIFCGCVVSIHW